MNSPKMTRSNVKRLLSGRTLLFALPAAAVVAILVAVVAPFGGKKDYSSAATYTVKRQDLDITVLESGNVAALRQQEINSQVEGQAKIQFIIEEGTVITQKDIDEERVLVELETDEVLDRLAQQEITLQSASASLTQAKESYDIQVKQNESNVKAAELKVRFTRMDFERYLGGVLAEELLERQEAAGELEQIAIDYAALVADERLGGEAAQRIRKLKNDIDLAEEELTRAQDKLVWTKQLYDEKFVSENEYEADKLAVKRREVEVEQAKTALDLFIRYEFPKEVEQRMSDHYEAGRELERTVARARSELAKAEATLMSSQATHRVQQERYDRLQEQINASVIYATHPGMVVYRSSIWTHLSPLEIGSTINKNDLIIAIPDITAMGAEIKVHEAAIERVRTAMKKGSVNAHVSIDAFPDKSFKGYVHWISRMPDRQHRWLNPDLRVYSTKIAVPGEHPELQPGLSCKVEIFVDTVPDVLAVPLQCVVPRGDRRVCFVLTNDGTVMREVETGAANDSMMEIISGLEEGERVLLNPPRYDPNGKALGAEEEEEQKLKEQEEQMLREQEEQRLQEEEQPQAPEVENGQLDHPQEQQSEEPEAGEERPKRNPQQLLERLPADVRERWEKMSQEEKRTEIQRLMQTQTQQ